MGTIPASDNEFVRLLLTEGAAAATPATGLVVAYAKSDGLLYFKDDAGTEYPVSQAADLAAHLADTGDAHDASAISVLDTAAVFTATDVEAALKELYDGIAGGGIPATIVDAAGDLIVGTADNTVARLAIGAAGGSLSRVNGAVAWNSGTAFPTATTGDRYWRTDIMQECFYDGTRWLTMNEYTISNWLSGAGIAADLYYTFPLNKTYQTYLTSWDVISYVSTATTWVVTLQTFDTELDGFATLDSVSTAAQNSAEMYATTRALDDVVDGTAAHGANAIRGLRVFYDEQAGSATFFGGINVRYRLIVT